MEKDVNNTEKSASALREEEVLKFWKENNIFEKSLEKDSPKGEYVFYDGPVTANSKPVLHTMEPFSFKDVIPRYKTMRGYHVGRKGGWDTHGLPVELQIEKKLGFKSKNDIENYGIAAFNKLCKESVWEYIELWKSFTKRMGYWADQENAYVTYSNDYIESVWNVVKTANEKKLLYKDYKVVPWCPRCGTTLSTHEIAQGYQDVKDLSVTAKFKLKNGSDGRPLSVSGQTSDTYILAWTTTPWTLPGNVALAVGKKIDYVMIEKPARPQEGAGGDNEFLILAKSRLSIIEGEYKIVKEMKGSDLVGLEYEPLYPYLINTISDTEKLKLEKAFKVYAADFVTTEDGTGVVHTAVMYGVDDFNLGNEIGLPKHHMVGLDGKFLAGTEFLEGRFVRDEEVAIDIIKDLAHRGLLFKKEKYEHSYPHCWRCKTALIYYARDSWYIGMSTLRDELVKENEGINWEPSYIKEGRFGEWLKDIKDWAISRERYWGTPLPVWICNDCNKREVLGSIDEIKSRTKKSGNKYWVIRHGEAENNVTEVLINKDNSRISKLTENGRNQVLESSKNFKEKIDIIIASPFERTRETTKIMCEQIGFPLEKVIYDENIHEWEASSIFYGKDRNIFEEYYKNIYLNNLFEVLPDSESFAQVAVRMGKFIYDLENKYFGKNILIVGHSGSTRILEFIIKGFSFENLSKEKNPPVYLKNAEIKELNFTPLSHNENYELDLHKPYIDEVELVCDCGGKIERTKEVMDVWLDSGAMPFAQDHYPFENKDKIEKGGGYPADFICEAIDQTRGWFYTLHAVGIIMGRGKAYKNVICLGHLLDAKGKKMSKSLGNVVDPWIMMDKYGADTIRLWMYSVNQPGESKNFDEKTVSELHSKVFNLLYNVLAFYELYRDKDLEKEEYVGSENILDKWIVSRLNELLENTTKQMDDYKLLEPVRAIRDFIDDLSTWYLRRSRDRIKSASAQGSSETKDGEQAKTTLYFVLKTLIKVMAPFTPFASEDIWQKLKNKEEFESIHLVEWPKADKVDIDIIKEMREVREVVTLGLQARQKAGIPVRQPLSKISISNFDFAGSKNGMEYFDIIKEELNIKNLYHNKDLILENKIELDLNITEDLKQEGNYRELVRAIQDIRKKNGLNPNDVITLVVDTNNEGQVLVNKFKSELMKTVIAKDVQFKENEGTEIKINDFVFVITVIK